MNTYSKKIAALCTAAALTLTPSAGLVSAAGNTVSVSQIGALLDSYAANSAEGTFTLTSDSRIFVVSSAEPTGDLLQTVQLINSQFKTTLSNDELVSPEAKLVWGPAEYAKEGDILLVLDASSGTGADGYKLNVGKTAKITAADTDGLIYGANMLMKCLRNSTTLSGFSAADTPDTKQRVVMLDTGRKYYTAEWIKNFIRQMSWMGYNALEIHFSEDGGFRADLWDENYYTDNYQPKNDFSWLCGSYVQSWVRDPYRTDPDAGRYLTTAELVDICNVAKEYHIELIPSFDSPAHMDYITWKFEQNYKDNRNYSFTYNNQTYKASSTSGCINYTGRTGASSPTWPYYTTIDITEDTMARAFVFALYEDMADFFREYAGSTNFNIGADEVNLSSSYGPKWNYSQFPGYVNELNRMLNSKGYTVRMFNDFIGSTTYNQERNTSEGISEYNSVYDFDKNIEICYWNSDFNPSAGEYSEPVWHVKFFWENNTGTSDNWGDGGRTMYNCIQTNTYYVLREGTSGSDRDARDPANRNWTFYGSNEEDIYNNWYPADISEKGDYTENAADVPAEQLGGAYFLIWNDYAALNTESEVWNGALDCCDEDRYYYLFDIMASNSIKMWNSDINSTVTYSTFAEIRETWLEWFPGFTSCSAAASLPEASSLESAAAPTDKSALANAVANKLSSENYTASSYAAYETAYNNAAAVNADSNADQDTINAVLSELNTAIGNLVDLTALNNALNSKIVNNDGKYTSASYAAYETAYQAAETVRSNAEATAEEIQTAISNLNNAANALVDLTELKNALANKISNDNSKYTDDSYAAYEAAYNAAAEVSEKSNVSAEEIRNALNSLTDAKNALVYAAADGNMEDLKKAVQAKFAEDTYSNYEAYETAFKNAEAVVAKGDNASAEEIAQALAMLKEAEANLVKIPASPAGGITVQIKAGETLINTLTFASDASSFYIPPQTGYVFESVATAGYKFTALASRDGSGYLTGTGKTSIVLQYASAPDTSYLEALLNSAYTSQGSFTSETWEAYESAINAAKNSPKETQAQVDALVNALLEAANNLATEENTDKIISIQKISSRTKSGKNVSLKVTTTSSVESLTVVNQQLVSCVSKVQTLNTGDVVKVWLIAFEAPFYASSPVTDEFTVTADNTVSAAVDITIIK